MRRYLERVGGAETNRALGAASLSGTCAVTHVEVTCSLNRLVHGKMVTQTVYNAAQAQLTADVALMWTIPVNEVVTLRAGVLGVRHRLKGYDAIHLSAACAWRSALGEPVSFVTFDDLLWAAADAEGFALHPPDLSLFK